MPRTGQHSRERKPSQRSIPLRACRVSRPAKKRRLWPETNAGAVIKPEPAAFGLLLWDFKPLAPPDPFNPLEVHIPTITPKQSRNPAIAITTVFRSKANDISRQSDFVIPNNLWFSLCGTVLAKNIARTALGTSKRRTNMINGQSATRRA